MILDKLDIILISNSVSFYLLGLIKYMWFQFAREKIWEWFFNRNVLLYFIQHNLQQIILTIQCSQRNNKICLIKSVYSTFGVQK